MVLFHRIEANSSRGLFFWGGVGLASCSLASFCTENNENLRRTSSRISGEKVAKTPMISSGGAAIAADLPRKAPVVAPAPLPVATWSGCYLTGGIGYGMWNQDNQSFFAPGGVADIEHTDGGRGWLGRVGGGCDYQFYQRWVVGVLADYDFASLKGDMTLPGLAGGLTGDEKNNWAWAVGGRLGYLPWDTLLTFVSGGYTQANFKAINFIDLGGLFPH